RHRSVAEAQADLIQGRSRRVVGRTGRNVVKLAPGQLGDREVHADGGEDHQHQHPGRHQHEHAAPLAHAACFGAVAMDTCPLLRPGVGYVRIPKRFQRHFAASQWTVTVPVVPSTVMVAPSAILRVASVTETTHGIPSSRETITAWVICAPTSTTTAAAGTNNG